ncbi:ABA4-like family protein [Streptosporangium sp. NPDC051023]|uniref:ABA4-like family protein n=1 Tax=Streptosporangium sp. NPDC051023 TaxID=3155410 RepID=UPI00344EBCA6
MTVDTLFAITFPLVVPFWALMIFAPTWSVTHRISSSPLIVLPPLAVYLVLAIPRFSALWTVVSTPDLGLITAFFGRPDGAAILWAHVIAFDLFIGRWMYLDSRERRVHPLLMGPVLLLTILLSPVGLLVYIAIRAFARPSAPDTPSGVRLPAASEAG